MKVLLVAEYASLNGGERSLLAVLPHLQQQGVRFVAAAPACGPLAAELGQLGIDVVAFSAAAASDGETLSLEDRRRRLARILSEVRPDLLHANSLAMSRLAGPVAAAAGVVSVGHIRDIVRLSKQAVRDVNCHRRLIAVSEATRRWHLGQGIDERRLVVAYNGIDSQRFHAPSRTGSLRRQLGIAADAQLIGGVGQIGVRKGWDLLLHALARGRPEASTTQAVIVGERHSTKREAIEWERQLHRQAAAPPLAGRVHFVGRLDSMPQFYAELDLLVHPARQEPLGRVLLEAAAAGVPVVATEVGGTREIFPVADDAAVIVPPDDASALAVAIDEVFAQPERTRRRRERAGRLIATRFAVQSAAERLEGIYRETLASNAV